MFRQLPENIFDFVKKQKVGHLSTVTPSGVLVHPVAYFCDGEGIYFGTPRGSVKLKWLKKNPNLSLTVDNGKLMKEALGITVQGKAEIFDMKRITLSLRSALKATYGYIKKYPELLKFYVGDMSELPDDRKFYKYVFVKIKPKRIVHWDGYQFGRIASKGKKEEEDPLQKVSEEDDPVLRAKYVKDYFNSIKSIGSELQDTEEVEVPLEQVTSEYLFNDETYGEMLQEDTMDAVTLLSLPDHVRKTGMVLLKMKRATLDEIIAKTGRSKIEEKNSLNRLVMMGIVKKRKEEEKLIYFIGE